MNRAQKVRRLLWYAASAVVLGLVIWGILYAAREVPIEELLSWHPTDPVKASLFAVGLYVFKCFDFIVHVGLIYTAVGVLLPTWGAIAMNLFGTLLMTELPYYAGRLIGHTRAAKLKDRFPRLRDAEDLLRDNVVIFSMLTRMLGVPLNVIGVYMGAADYDHRWYTIGSFLGLLPTMACFMVMGAGVADRSGSTFWIALGVQVAIAVTAILVFQLLKKKTTQTQK